MLIKTFNRFETDALKSYDCIFATTTYTIMFLFVGTQFLQFPINGRKLFQHYEDILKNVFFYL